MPRDAGRHAEPLNACRVKRLDRGRSSRGKPVLEAVGAAVSAAGVVTGGGCPPCPKPGRVSWAKLVG